VKRAGEKAAGFTLVEVVMVLVISGILASAVVSAAARLGELKAEAAVNTLAAHLRYLQALAMSRNSRTWAVFDQAASTYRGYMEDHDHPGAAHRLAALDPLSRKPMVVDLHAGILTGLGITSIGFGGGSELCFDPYGVPFNAAGTALSQEGTIVLSTLVTVAVSPETGTTSIRP
jgi:prepilin-type N-terminal cleavage/methylation domain-containing protein